MRTLVENQVVELKSEFILRYVRLRGVPEGETWIYAFHRGL